MSDSGNGSTSDEFTVLLEGGRPWGFTLYGGADFRSPLKVGKVTNGGRAQASGLLSKDVILSINGVPTAQMKHHEAQRLITSSKTTLELVCTKSAQSAAFSPKSVTQERSFDFPDVLEKSKTLGNRHIRQKSLDLNFRPRSVSDAGKKATVGTKIAGIIVPPPPPKTKTLPRKLSEPEFTKHKPVKVIAGIEVPRPPPTVSAVNGTSTSSIQSDKEEKPEEIVDVSETANNTTTICPSPLSSDLDDHPVVSETVNPPQIVEAEIITYKVELTNLHEVSPIPSDTVADSQRKKEVVPPTVGVLSAESEEQKELHDDDSSLAEEDRSPEVPIMGKNDDWYKSMFQSMKKGVEEDIPNKKPVWDRSPVPARKSSHEFESKTSPNYKYKNTSYTASTGQQRRFSESSLPSPITSPSYSPIKQSSSGSSIGFRNKTADVVSEVSAGVIYQKNVKKYNQSRNYWKSIERQASQEQIELEAKRNSLRRTSSSSSTGKVSSPDALTGSEDSSTQNQTPTTFFKEEVVNILSAYQSLIPEEDSKGSTVENSKESTIEDSKKPTVEDNNTKVPSVSPESKDEGDLPETTMAKLHPLLKDDLVVEDKPEDVPHQDVFSRIDASKLSSAIGNASVLGTMSQEGADPLTLQAAALSMGKPQQQEPQKSVAKKKKSKTTKPPPGKKAKAKFDFVADSEKELSLKKGEIVDLTEQIDENWLKGEFQGKSGIFPVSYVQVLTAEEVSLLQSGSDPTTEPELNKLARAKFDFTASTDRELSLTKGEILTVLKDKDENWYEVSVEDKVGIVPKTYVEVIELENDLH